MKGAPGQFPPGQPGYPPGLNGGPINPPLDSPSQAMAPDTQSQWMPNVQSPSHAGRPPMQQPGPYMNGASGQPPPGINRGPLPPGKNTPYAS